VLEQPIDFSRFSRYRTALGDVEYKKDLRYITEGKVS
jgi:hypothetical protein